MKYCPNCGAEYRPGYERCSDCQVGLVDEPPAVASTPQMRPKVQDRIVVFRSGRRMDAELVRSRLEADGLDARIWSTGLGPWRMEAALTEITGVPNDFNSHRVVVDPIDLDRALEVLRDAAPDSSDEQPVVPGEDDRSTLLASLRKRWMLLAFAIFMLLLVIVAGPIGN